MAQHKIKQFDKLTGLPYYEDFLSIAEEVKEAEFADGREIVVIATDISNFKLINQIYGYEAGNTLLQNLVKHIVLDNQYCLAACRPYSDHILGVYLKPSSMDKLKKEMDCYTNNFIVENSNKFQSVLLHLQSGIYIMNDSSESIMSGVDRANIARRRMKGDYNISYMFFDESMLKGKERTSETITAFETALRNNDILVYYQPKMNIVTKTLEGAEALSRIRKPDGTIMNPGDYINILETSGRIIDLDFYMMRSVFSMIKTILSRGGTPVTISINLSRIHFYNERMVQEIMREFEQYDIPAEYIEFEVTESAFMSESAVISGKLEELKSYGFKVSMDDFGTGYSSLHSLSVLPIDIVKFDRSFVKNCTSSPKGLKILSGLITLCKQIDFDVICEGVEDEAEENIVRVCGCDYVQGYVYDKPLPEFIFTSKYLRKTAV